MPLHPRERVLRAAGLLRHEHQPRQLHEGPDGHGQRRRRQQRHQLGRHLLHHAAHRRLPRRRLPRPLLDHRLLHDHLHLRPRPAHHGHLRARPRARLRLQGRLRPHAGPVGGGLHRALPHRARHRRDQAMRVVVRGRPVRRARRRGAQEQELVFQLVLLLHQHRRAGGLVRSGVRADACRVELGLRHPRRRHGHRRRQLLRRHAALQAPAPRRQPAHPAQVLVAATRKLGVPVDGSALYETADRESGIEGSRKLEHTEQFRFLDKAAVETQADKTATGPSPWRLCTVTQVEELKSVVRLLPIWASGIVFATVYGQMSTMFVLQGNTLDASMGPKFKIPSASLSIFDTLSVIAWVPVYDRILVPAVRSVTGRPRGFTQLQRMGIGLVVSMFAMLAAGVLELVRLRTIAQRGLYGEHDVVPISIFWQVPQYFIIGAAEVFTFVGQLEFFYDQAPDAMRSMCSALSLTTVALGNYLSTLLVTVVAKLTTRGGKQGWIPDNLNVGHLDYFFWLLAALSLLNFAVYLLIASWYTYKKTAGDDHPDAIAKGGAHD
ncbi:hypothetical protein VPH35_049574 [Triticum aestivum]